MFIIVELKDFEKFMDFANQILLVQAYDFKKLNNKKIKITPLF